MQPSSMRQKTKVPMMLTRSTMPRNLARKSRDRTVPQGSGSFLYEKKR